VKVDIAIRDGLIAAIGKAVRVGVAHLGAPSLIKLCTVVRGWAESSLSNPASAPDVNALSPIVW
jgi:hypothetical protein